MRRRRSAVQRYLDRDPQTTTGLSEAEVAPVYGLPAMESLVAATAGEADALPDLLHPSPSARIEFHAARRALEFAFTAGDAAGVSRDALSGAALAPSSWQATGFVDELFVGELVDKVLTFEVQGRRARLERDYLMRLLTRPPRDLAIAGFRQQVLAELRERSELRDALREAYARVSTFLRLLDEADGEGRYGMPRWRLETLGAIRALFDALHQAPFDTARSGLSRLHTYAAHVRTSEGYARLAALLDYEGDMARVQLEVRIGADGSVRELSTLARTEHAQGPYYRGPLARLWARLVHALRGYQLSEAPLLDRYLDHVFAGVLPFLPVLLQLRGDLEFYLANLQLERAAERRGLRVSLAEFVDEADVASPKEVRGLFNPLLLMQQNPPVPCDLSLPTFERSCILTGPNSGGKTRLLQALALSQMLGQAGGLVPASQARLKPSSGIFVSLAQTTSADAHEGRLGTELLRIRRLFEQAQLGCFIVLDELCSGTNPQEGEEIFHLVIDLLRELSPEVYITTHFLQFAASLEAADDARLCFLQVELEAEHPTYRFVPGVARTSLAHRTAARLGVSREELLALVRRRVR